LAIIGAGIYGFWQGAPERDIGSAVHRGDRAAVRKLLTRNAGLARAKVYPQRSEPWRTGRGITNVEWRGGYLVHDTVSLGGNPAMLELLAASGADLKVRLEAGGGCDNAHRPGSRKGCADGRRRGAPGV